MPFFRLLLDLKNWSKRQIQITHSFAQTQSNEMAYNKTLKWQTKKQYLTVELYIATTKSLISLFSKAVFFISSNFYAAW